MQPDFSLLYAQLELTPDCGLEELKRAYRRRIAELHPDRTSPAEISGRPTMPISDLNSIYSQALRFHRSHGRLPGARFPEPALPAGSRRHAEVPLTAHNQDNQSSNDTAPHWRLGPIMVLLGLILVLSWLAYTGSASIQVADSTDVPKPEEPRKTESPRRQKKLEAGMSTESVRTVLGDPVTIRGDEWDYGPSWIRFEEGKLAQWHSSPLNPLVVKNYPDTASTD